MRHAASRDRQALLGISTESRREALLLVEPIFGHLFAARTAIRHRHFNVRHTAWRASEFFDLSEIALNNLTDHSWWFEPEPLGDIDVAGCYTLSGTF
jgi:hypothetical protein